MHLIKDDPSQSFDVPCDTNTNAFPHTNTHTQGQTKDETDRWLLLIVFVFGLIYLPLLDWLETLTGFDPITTHHRQSHSSRSLSSLQICKCVCVCAALTITLCTGVSGPAFGTDAAEACWVFHTSGFVHTWRWQTGMFHWGEGRKETREKHNENRGWHLKSLTSI